MNFSWQISFSNVIGLRNLVKCADFFCVIYGLMGNNKRWICEGGVKEGKVFGEIYGLLRAVEWDVRNRYGYLLRLNGVLERN